MAEESHQTATCGDDEPVDTIAIALSGGGSRAALYALGVLLYIVHSGLNKNVRLISSVSGGSIVNAALSLGDDFSTVSSPDFDKTAGRLANQLANRGIFFWPGWRKALPPLSFLLIWSPLFFLATNGLHNWNWGLVALGDILYATPMTLYFLAYIWFGRGATQRARYADLVARSLPGEKNKKSAGRAKLSQSPDSRVRHVLCATELTSGRPFYMDRHEIRSPAYGSGDPNLSISNAIYASAAFPIGFPPLRIKTATLNMSGGDMEERPKELLLCDGGVFNNLGTDSFTAWSTVGLDPFRHDPRFIEFPIIKQHIVINASSPGKLTHIPRLWIWRNLVTVQRIMAVLYENTLRPRVEALLSDEAEPDGTLVIDVANSPIDIAERLTNFSNGDERERGRDTLEKLRLFKHSAYWQEYSARASSTKTVLRAVGETAAIRLLRLGYLDATITCHVRLNSAGLGQVPSEAWFHNLVKDQVKSAIRLDSQSAAIEGTLQDGARLANPNADRSAVAATPQTPL